MASVFPELIRTVLLLRNIAVQPFKICYKNSNKKSQINDILQKDQYLDSLDREEHNLQYGLHRRLVLHFPKFLKIWFKEIQSLWELHSPKKVTFFIWRKMVWRMNFMDWLCKIVRLSCKDLHSRMTES